MASVTRIDQAVLLLRERLRRLGEQRGAASSAPGDGGAVQSGRSDPLLPLRQLVQRGGIAPDELRKAFIRTLLADALGDGLARSLEFQSISDQVLRIIEATEAGQQLIEKALSELE